MLARQCGQFEGLIIPLTAPPLRGISQTPLYPCKPFSLTFWPSGEQNEKVGLPKSDHAPYYSVQFTGRVLFHEKEVLYAIADR